MADAEQPPRRTRAAEVIDASRTAAVTLAGFRPEQVQTIALLFFTVFVCVILGWTLYQSPKEQARQNAESIAAIIRSMEAQAELSRQQLSAEAERNRVAMSANAALVAASQEKVIVAVTKLQVEVERLQNTLERKLPLPPECEIRAPPPRVKVE